MCYYIVQHCKKIYDVLYGVTNFAFYFIQYPIIHKLVNVFYKKIENVAVNPRTLTCEINLQFYIVTYIIRI